MKKIKKEVEKHIKKAMKKGYSKEHIKKVLEEKGWPKHFIKEVLPKKTKKETFLLNFFFFLGLILASLSAISYKWFSLIIGILIILTSIKLKTKSLKKVIIKKPVEKKLIEKKPKNFLLIFMSLVGLVLAIYSFLKALWILWLIGLYIIFFSLFVYKLKAKKIKKIRLEHKKTKPIIAEFKLLPKKSHETDLDVLYKLVEEHKKISIEDIAKKFKISKEKVEEWAQILVESNLIKIEYPAFGAPILKKWNK